MTVVFVYRSGETARKLVAPLAYAVVYILSIYLVVQALVSERIFFIRIPWKLYYEVPALYYGTPLLLICLMFWLCGLGTLRLERPSRPGFRDHLRRYVFLYTGLLLVVLLSTLAFLQGFQGRVLALLGVAGMIPAALAVVIDVLVLAWQRRHIAPTNQGGQV